MERHAIERWTDTTAFGFALAFAAVLVLPVLALGVVTSAIAGAAMISAWSTGERELELGIAEAVLPLLSLGGALGFAGYVRAHWAVKDPARHNVTATLVFLAAGVLTAASVAAFVVVMAVGAWVGPWGSAVWLLPAALFATANLAWLFAGIAWMQRLLHRYAEQTGRAFDGLPVVLLLVAIALAIAVALKTTTL